MISEFLDIEDKEELITFRQKLLENNFYDVEYFKDALAMTGMIVTRVLPNTEEAELNVTSTLYILIDDILEMESITQVEKDKAIWKLVEIDKPDLCNLIQKLFDKMEADAQEALNNGYCKSLLRAKGIMSSVP